jgi:hypothetical protein
MSIPAIITIPLCTATPVHLPNIRDAATTLGVVLDETRMGVGLDVTVSATGPANKVAILQHLVGRYIAEFQAAVGEKRRSWLQRALGRNA